MQLAGYRLGEDVYRSDNSVVRRAIRLADERPVFVKALPDERPPPDKLTRLRREYAVTRGFYDVSSSGVLPFLFFPDFLLSAYPFSFRFGFVVAPTLVARVQTSIRSGSMPVT